VVKTTELEPETLKDFELKFYEGMVKFGELVKEITNTKIMKCIPTRKIKNAPLIIELQLDTRGNEMATTKILTQIKKLQSHFVVFYTPAHYRPQPMFKITKVKYKDEILITGTYKEK
jgi:hypothetical protein